MVGQVSRFRFLLTVNVGSSTVRLDLFDCESGEPETIASHKLDGTQGNAETELRAFLRADLPPVDAVVHRLVHGGLRLRSPSVLGSATEDLIEQAVPFAPLHNARSLIWLRATRLIFGGQLPQIMVPDTAFFTNLPEVAARYPIDRDLADRLGIRRFGFHGIAHQGMVEAWSSGRSLEEVETSRLITLQLGSGCSAAAIKGGWPVDTSMGFSPLEGLPMATRSGDLDPGIILYLLSQGFDGRSLDDLLNRRSGLAGLSGGESDMRALLAEDTSVATMAVEIYCYRIRKYVGSYIAVLGGLDALLFSGGVGENSPEIRRRIVGGLEWIGLKVDPAVNQATVGRSGEISSPNGQPAAVVVKVDEGRLMARVALGLLSTSPIRR